MAQKTLLVGWDSVCWEYLNPLLEREELPNLRKLIDLGCCGSLQSTIPPITPAAWGSILTGKLPQNHGVYDWVWESGGELRVASSADLMGTPFWQRLNGGGIRVGLVNIPLTYPTSPIKGFMVCGFGAPEPPATLTYPAAMLAEIKAKFGGYTPVLPSERVWEFQRSENQQALYATEARIQAVHVEAALYGAIKHDVDVLAINLMLFDHTNHRAPNLGLVAASLRETDRQLGLLIQGFGPDDVLLFSDHGARRFCGVFLLGDWLADRGYMVRRRKAEQTAPELNYLLLQYLTKGLGIRGKPEKAIRAVLRTIMPRLPDAIANIFWRDVKARVPGAYDHYWLDPVETDSDSSPVSRSLNAGTIYFNRGCTLPQHDAKLDKVYGDLVEELKSVRHPAMGEKLFQRVLTSADLYGANPPGNPPDLFVDYYPSEFGLRSAMGAGLRLRFPYFAYLADNPQVSMGWYGDHSHEGVWVSSGSSFRQGRSGAMAHLVDIAPTLLHLYGVPLPADYDGQVLTEAMTVEHAIRTQPGDVVAQEREQDGDYDEAEAEQVMSQLRALGYVD